MELKVQYDSNDQFYGGEIHITGLGREQAATISSGVQALMFRDEKNDDLSLIDETRKCAKLEAAEGALEEVFRWCRIGDLKPNKIHLIRLVRAMTELGLKDAKGMVDRLWDIHINGAPAPQLVATGTD